MKHTTYITDAFKLGSRQGKGGIAAILTAEAGACSPCMSKLESIASSAVRAVLTR